MAKKDYAKLIKEEAARAKAIVEYTFVGVTEAEEPTDDVDAAVGDIEGELDMDGGEPEGDAEGFGDEAGGEPEGEGAPELDAAMDAEPEMEPEMPAEDEVELDVTELVNSTEEAKMASDMANAKLEDLINGFGTLQQQMASMEKIHGNIEELGSKVTDLEHDIERRNPTPEEQIEMRSLDSYPYSIKLTDYWSDNEDKLAIPKEEVDGKTKEYVLTKQDVDDYSPNDIKKSFRNFDEEEVDL